MHTNRPQSKWPAGALMVIVVFLILIPPATAAEQMLIDSRTNSDYNTYPDGVISIPALPYIKVYDIRTLDGWEFFYLRSSVGVTSHIIEQNPSYSAPVTLKVGDTVVGTGTANYNGLRNAYGTYDKAQFWLDIESFDYGTLAGTQTIEIIPDGGTLFNGAQVTMYQYSDVINAARPIGFFHVYPAGGDYIVRTNYYWQNAVEDTGTSFRVVRNFDGEAYTSSVNVSYGTTIIPDVSKNDISIPYVGTGNWNVTSPKGKVFTGTLGTGSPTTPTSDTVTVYVRNSQTGALLANAQIDISANVNGTFHEVVNETAPSGIYSIDLQPTGGGMPNPDYYRLWVTLDGYNSQMPYIDFEVSGGTSVYVYMEPTTGGPADENKTYIEFYVRDLNANPIAGAAVTCGGYTLITNSAGYTQFELPNNAAYPYRVTKSGYVTIEGTATVADGPRYVANVVLSPDTVPTYTPTLGPGATPTPDTRTNEQKGQAIIDLIADFAEPIAILAILATIFGLMKMMTPGRR